MVGHVLNAGKTRKTSNFDRHNLSHCVEVTTLDNSMTSSTDPRATKPKK